MRIVNWLFVVGAALFIFGVGFVVVGAKRTTPTDWLHTAFDGPSLTREFTKWDDTPGSLTHFGESMIRGYKQHRIRNQLICNIANESIRVS